MFSVLLIASYTVLELGSILGPEVSGEFLKWMDRNLPSMCAIPRRMIFCSSLMLLAPGIFHKFWSIPSLRNPSATTITSTVSLLIPHILMVSISARSLYSESFSMTFVEVFRLDGTDTVYICKFATLVGMVFDHYIRVVCWHFPICIIIIIIIIIISLIVPSFLLTNAWMFHFVLKKKTGYNHKNILKVKRLNLTSLFQWHWCPLWLTFLSSLEIHSLCTFFQLYLSQPVLWLGHSDDQKVVKKYRSDFSSKIPISS